MKTIIAGLLITFCFSAFSQPVKISGKILNTDKNDLMHLTNIAQKDIPIKINKDGHFSTSIADLKSGCFLLPDVGYIYVEPGYDLTITPNKDGNYTFNGKGSLENNLMVKAKKMFGDYFPMGNDLSFGTNGFLFSALLIMPDSFLHKLEIYKTQANLLLDKSISNNFKTIAKGDIDSYCRNMLGNYIMLYGTDSIKQQNYDRFLSDSVGKTSTSRLMAELNKTYVKRMEMQQRLKLYNMQFKGVNMNDSLLFVNSDEYRKILSSTIENKVMTNFIMDFIARVPQPIIKLKVVNKTITNSFIHDYYAYTLSTEIIKMQKDSVLKDSVYHDFMAHATNPIYRDDINKLYKNFIDFGNNKMSPDFTYINANGKNVSLKELRGKYVYIDVWATWCEPCKREIPYLSTIENAYEGKNIQFVSLSVDSPKDKNKWLQYVKTKQLKGTQLMADNAFESDFIMKFNINSIPRFILIAPDGKIVSSDALRPSDATLRNTLDALL